jgi:hypothetical protein
MAIEIFLLIPSEGNEGYHRDIPVNELRCLASLISLAEKNSATTGVAALMGVFTE